MSGGRGNEKNQVDIDHDRAIILDILRSNHLDTVITSIDLLKRLQMLLQMNGLDTSERDMLRTSFMDIVHTKGSLYLPSLSDSIMNNISKVFVLLIIADFPSHWSQAFQQLTDMIKATPQASHLVLTILDLLYGCIKDNTREGRRGGSSRMEERFNYLLAQLTSRETSSQLMGIFTEMINLYEEQITEGALCILGKFIEWIGFVPIVNHIFGKRLLSIVEPNRNTPAVTVAAWNVILEMFKYPVDLDTKLMLLRSFPVLEVLQSADATTKSIGSAVAAVAATLGKDVMLCWRVFGYEGHPLHNICATFMQTSMALNFKLLSPYSNRQARHVVMSYIKCFVEEIQRIFSTPGAVSSTFISPIGSLLSSLQSCLQLPSDFSFEILHQSVLFGRNEDASPTITNETEVEEQSIRDLRTEASFIFKDLARACPSIIVSSVSAGLGRCLSDPSVPFTAFESVLQQLFLLSPETTTDFTLLDSNIVSAIAFLHSSFQNHPSFSSLHYSIPLAYYQVADRYLIVLRNDSSVLVPFLHTLGSVQGLKSSNPMIRKYAIYLLQRISEDLQDVLAPYINGLLIGVAPLLVIPVDSSPPIETESERNRLYETVGTLIGSYYITVEERAPLLQAVGGHLVTALNNTTYLLHTAMVQQRESGRVANDGQLKPMLRWIKEAIAALSFLATGYSKSMVDFTPSNISSYSYTNMSSMMPRSTSRGTLHGGKSKKVPRSASDTKLYNVRGMSKRDRSHDDTTKLLSNMFVSSTPTFATESHVPRDIPSLWGGSTWFIAASKTIINICEAAYEIETIRKMTVNFLSTAVDCCNGDIVPILTSIVPNIVNQASSSSELLDLGNFIRKCVNISNKEFKNLTPVVAHVFLSLMGKIYSIIKPPVEILGSDASNEVTRETITMQRLFFRLVNTITRSEFVSDILLTEENLAAVGPLLEALLEGCTQMDDLPSSKLAFSCLQSLIEVWLVNDSKPLLGSGGSAASKIEGFQDSLRLFAANHITPVALRLALRPDVDQADLALINDISKFLFDMRCTLGNMYVEYLGSDVLQMVYVQERLIKDFISHLCSDDSLDFSVYFERFLEMMKSEHLEDDTFDEEEEDGDGDDLNITSASDDVGSA